MGNDIYKKIILFAFIVLGIFVTKGFLSGNLGPKEYFSLLIIFAIFIYNLNLKQFIYLILFLYFIYPFFQRYFLFPSLPPLTHTMLILIEYIIVRFIKKNQIKIFKINFLEKFTIILILLAIFSSIINLNNPLLTIKSLLTYFLPFILLGILMSKSKMDELTQKKILQLILILLIIQIPVSFVQGITRVGSPDGNNGTLVSSAKGGTGTTAVLASLLFIFFYLRIIKERFNIQYLLLMLVAPIPIIMGSGRFGLILIFLSLIISPFVVNYLKKKKNIFNFILVFSFNLLLIFTLIIGLKNYLPNIKIAGWDVAFSLLSQKESILEYGGYYNREGRIGDYVYVSALQKEPIKKLFGFGGGSIARSRTIQESGELRNQITSHTFGVNVFSSLGYVGVIFFITFLIVLQYYLGKYLKQEKNKYFIYWGLSIVVFIFSFMLSALYTRLWDNQVGLVFFIITGILLNRYYNYNRIIASENP